MKNTKIPKYIMNLWVKKGLIKLKESWSIFSIKPAHNKFEKKFDSVDSKINFILNQYIEC